MKALFFNSLKIMICLTVIYHTSAWNTVVKFNKFVPESRESRERLLGRFVTSRVSKKAIQSYTASNRIWSFFSFVCALKKFSHKQRQC